MKDANDIILSVIIPCFNEKEYIQELIEKVKNAPVPNKEIIIVDDCSTDGTKEIIKNEIESRVAKVIYHEKNRGKGAALRDGFKEATGDIVIVQDADLEYNPNEYGKLIKPIVENKADVVYGSRFIGSHEHRVLWYWHTLGNRVLTTLSNMLTNINLSDMETCYKVFAKDVIKKLHLKENRFGIEPEITAKVAKLKCRIYDVGISYSGRTYAQGKKIGWKDGMYALYCILRYNLFP